MNNDRFVEGTAAPEGHVAATLGPQQSREDAPAVAEGEIFVHPLPCLSGAVSHHVKVVVSHKVEQGKRTRRDWREEKESKIHFTLEFEIFVYGNQKLLFKSSFQFFGIAS